LKALGTKRPNNRMEPEENVQKIPRYPGNGVKGEGEKKRKEEKMDIGIGSKPTGPKNIRHKTVRIRSLNPFVLDTRKPFASKKGIKKGGKGRMTLRDVK